MKKVAKNIAKKLLVVLLFTTPLLHAGSFGESFGGSFLGSTLSNAMVRPRRTKTIVVQNSGNVTRAEAQRLESQLASQVIDIENRVRKDLNTLLDRIRKGENKIRNLEDIISRLKGDLDRLRKQVSINKKSIINDKKKNRNYPVLTN